jgi:hypothetical protein
MDLLLGNDVRSFEGMMSGIASVLLLASIFGLIASLPAAFVNAIVVTSPPDAARMRRGCRPPPALSSGHSRP